MEFYPCNRHLFIRGIEDEEEAKEDAPPVVLVPDTYKVQVEEHGAYEVLGMSADCTIDMCCGDIALVDNSMVKEIKFKGKIYTVVLENYVFGYLETGESQEDTWET